MSSKATLFLTNANEHWYHEGNARYYEGTKAESAFVLEIAPKHKIETDEEGTFIVIEEGTELFESLAKALDLEYLVKL